MPKVRTLSHRKCIGCRCFHTKNGEATCSIGIIIKQVHYDGWIDYKPTQPCDKPVTHAAYSQLIYKASGIREIIPIEHVS